MGVKGTGLGQVGQGINQGFSGYGQGGGDQILGHNKSRNQQGSEEVSSREET